MRKFNPDKELRKIQHGTRDKIFIGAFLLLLIISISSTYALYQVRYSKRIIYTKVAPFSSKDLDLAIYVDGKPNELPEKGKGYYYESITCENDPHAVAGWDYKNWKLGAISVTVPNKCNINFTSKIPFTLVELVKNVSEVNSDMVVEDETKDKNLRYIGKDPNNYIWFNCNDYSEAVDENNCEKWRIIGLMNNMTIVDETTKAETKNQSLIKIIRANSIGNLAWDTGGGEYGSNNWARPATLQTSLNSTYYNGTQLSDNYGNSAKGITNQTKNMIENIKWNIGGTYITNYTSKIYYTTEREGATWPGKIALMYPSDYGYATSGLASSDTINRIGCLNQNLDSWNSESYKTACAENDWLWDSSSNQWTLMAFTGYSSDSFTIESNGSVYNSVGRGGCKYETSVRPSLYLKSSVKIVSGNGSSEAPYVLIT